MYLANGASCQPAGTNCYRKSREFSLHVVPDSKIRLIATHCFSPIIQVSTVSPPAFAFPCYFLKIENIWAAQVS